MPIKSTRPNSFLIIINSHVLYRMFDIRDYIDIYDNNDDDDDYLNLYW